MKKILFALVLFGAVMTPLVYANTSIAKAELCAACHGEQGISTNPEWPNLAGQHASYLIKQLQDFKKGSARNASTMTPLVAALSDEEVVDLANLYTEKTPPSGTTPEKFFKRGEILYRGGDFAKHITACIACHGPRGGGNAQANFPLLSGQHAVYTIQQLQAFKEGRRANDLNSIMRDISARMSQEDMEAVAFYIQGLH